MQVTRSAVSSGSNARLILAAAAVAISHFPVASSATPREAELAFEEFDLYRHAEGERFTFSELGESILVLDFFAYWCGPCRNASTRLEHEIRRYYESQGSNPARIPVSVVSINVESAHPEKTNAFIRATGAHLVLDDPGGRLLASLGGTALPYIVVIDGRYRGDRLGWDVLYQHSGYEGAEVLRSVIDAVGQTVDRVELADSERFRVPIEESGIPLARQKGVQPVAEVLTSGDITIGSIAARADQAGGRIDWMGDFSTGLIDMDYEPVPEADVIGVARHLREWNFSGQMRVEIPDPVSTDTLYRFTAGGYQGFTDYRSLWLDEYYRQQFSRIEGYQEADPWGVSAAAGFRRDTHSPLGVVSGTVSYQRDNVAPGYDKPLFQPLERGRETLHTTSLTFSVENLLGSGTRALHETQITKTTDRGIRYGYRLFINQALGEQWVVRGEGAVTYEEVELEGESDFRSYSAGITVERDWGQEWFLGATARLYDDNGQIETSILVSSGPPPLQTRHLGVNLRWQSENTAWRLSVAGYQTRYDDVDKAIQPFGNLYKNRDWLMSTLSFQASF